ncbi:MAG: Jag N-terminal domain-containing protein, partial [Chloroflexota bacterium]
MSATELMIEARGSDVEAAIRSGLLRLGRPREEVVIEVVDSGSRGILGIGSREAVVRLTPLPQPAVEPPAVVVEEAPAPVEAAREEAAAAPESEDEAILREGRLALEIVQTLLKKMQVQATASMRLSEPDDLSGRPVPIIDIRGRDLSILIGPQNETLQALQYVARLMVGHQLHGRASFVVDIEGLRERRAQALARLAQHMADKVVKRGQPISLEPMPPNERRVI